ncbi:M23 family metallopeptidase [[Actinomadura] parvosata]|uniref:M23 family metallopeptidase n=1 Tax=[Actinomadura] parvosata TaxID=1955412 RepID=UPI0009AD34AE|nr:M23 family metallopeptidase [Nonomuraea sp. ATCC 55076]
MPTISRPAWPNSRKAAGTALLLALAATLVPEAASAQTVSVSAVSHQSPFDCGKTFYANNWKGGHNPSGAIDWQNYGGESINGKTVRATAAGTATFHNEGNTSYGKWVEIRHADGSRTRYAHLSSMVRGVGATLSVGQGTVIGTVGSTGGSQAPHLHYEQRTPSGAMDTSPTVNGVTVSLGQKKAIKSTNACGGAAPAPTDNGGGGSGSGNRYTPQQVCGAGFAVIDSAPLTGGRAYLLYNAGNGNNCVVTLKSSNVGKSTPVSAFLEPKGQKPVTDKGNYGYYAGPVKAKAAGVCVKWGGTIGSASYASDFEHCD